MFRVGSAWTVGLTLEMKLRFQVPPPGVVGTEPKTYGKGPNGSLVKVTQCDGVENKRNRHKQNNY